GAKRFRPRTDEGSVGHAPRPRRGEHARVLHDERRPHFRRGNTMKFSRQQFLRLAVGSTALPVVSRIGSAQTYPSRPLHIIVGFAAGGGNDIVARLMGQWLSERLGQPVLIEIGAAGNIATESVVTAVPDGYTLLQVSSTNARNTTLYEKLKFIFHRDIAPVAS